MLNIFRSRIVLSTSRSFNNFTKTKGCLIDNLKEGWSLSIRFKGLITLFIVITWIHWSNKTQAISGQSPIKGNCNLKEISIMGNSRECKVIQGGNKSKTQSILKIHKSYITQIIWKISKFPQNLPIQIITLKINIWLISSRISINKGWVLGINHQTHKWRNYVKTQIPQSLLKYQANLSKTI